MRVLRDIAILAALMALATWIVGWWTVPLVGAVAALWDRGGIVLKAALAGTMAWAVLLLLQDVLGGSVSQLGHDLALSLGVPSSAPLVLTLLLPAALAGSAAGTVVGLTRFRRVGKAPSPASPNQVSRAVQ